MEKNKLTRAEIPNLKAGRELDALVDSLLFGREIKMWTHYGEVQIQIEEYGGPRSWSTDDCLAWNIVERIKELGYCVRIEYGNQPGNNYLFTAWSKNMTERGPYPINVRKESISFAASIAALLVYAEVRGD